MCPVYGVLNKRFHCTRYIAPWQSTCTMYMYVSDIALNVLGGTLSHVHSIIKLVIPVGA